MPNPTPNPKIEIHPRPANKWQTAVNLLRRMNELSYSEEVRESTTGYPICITLRADGSCYIVVSGTILYEAEGYEDLIHFLTAVPTTQIALSRRQGYNRG